MPESYKNMMVFLKRTKISKYELTDQSKNKNLLMVAGTMLNSKLKDIDLNLDYIALSYDPLVSYFLVNQIPGNPLDLGFSIILTDSANNIYLLSQLAKNRGKPQLTISTSDHRSFFRNKIFSYESQNRFLRFHRRDNFYQRINYLSSLKI